MVAGQNAVAAHGTAVGTGCELRSLVLNLLIIGLAITLEPVTIVAFILILAAEKGTMKGLAFILGWLACLVAVIAIVVLVTGGKSPRPQTAPSTAALAVKVALGIVLILFAVRQQRRVGPPRKPATWMAEMDRLSPWAAAGLGVFCSPGLWWQPAQRPSCKPNSLRPGIT